MHLRIGLHVQVSLRGLAIFVITETPELAADGIAVSLVLPSITATEFGGGRYQQGREVRPGMVAHDPEYVAQVILRALRTGEERIDIPHGAQKSELTTLPSS